MSDKEQGIYTHILKYIGVFGGVQGLSIIIGVLRNKLVAVLLGPAGMGLVSLFNTMLNFISQATSFGISFSAIRTMSELYDAGKPEEGGALMDTLHRPAWHPDLSRPLSAAESFHLRQ